MPKKVAKNPQQGKKLTPNQRLFVAEYLKDLNATQAAIRAGYPARTANKQGPRLLVNVGIQYALTQARNSIEKKEEKALLDAYETVRYLDMLIRQNPKRYCRDHDECPRFRRNALGEVHPR